MVLFEEERQKIALLRAELRRLERRTKYIFFGMSGCLVVALLLSAIRLFVL